MKISDTPPFLRLHPPPPQLILPTHPFFWEEKSEPPTFFEFFFIFLVEGWEASNYALAFSSSESNIH